RSYGFAAAAQVYYGKNINELRVEQLAMLAGLPKAPSANNPITNLKRASIRRNYVLDRMHDLEYIDEASWQQARESYDDARLHGLNIELEAPYVAEMVRAQLVEQYGTDAYASGYRVFTTLDTRMQRYANTALKRALLDYDRRHGWRGAEARLTLDQALLAALPEAVVVGDKGEPQTPAVPDIARELLEPLRIQLLEFSDVGELEAVVVVQVGERSLLVLRSNGELVQLGWDVIEWARPYINENYRGPKPRSAAAIAGQGDVVRLERRDDTLWLAQLPEVEGALVALAPENGAVRSLVGGFDFYQSKFNRVTQAERQPGSNFKPFIYSAALENGFTTASVINDAPVVFEDRGLEDTWRPENYSGKFYGPTRLREALINSRNLVSIRLLRTIGIKTAINYAERFGFNPQKLPHDLSLALGSASLPPIDIVRGYAVFANGGYLIEPYFIERIEESDGTVLFEADPLIVCEECEQQSEKTAAQNETMPTADAQSEAQTVASGTVDTELQAEEKTPRLAQRVITEQNAFLMRTLMRDVVRYGTGRRALQTGRRDLAGKTGTTNDQKDAWFSGYSSSLVTSAWVGFDMNKPLGSRETGARAALPMWVDFMGHAMKGVPEVPYEQPAGLVTVRIDPRTGMLADNSQQDAIFEIFREANVPQQGNVSAVTPGAAGDTHDGDGITEQLF
ncbi:MAG: penicillin-binding transpeptidase domain-containing protein, partial [Granulosicoccaceae bacterium]